MNARSLALRFYFKCQSAIAPNLEYCQNIYERVLGDVTTHIGCGKWLDLGCGHQLLPHWRRSEEAELTARPALMVGLDYDKNSIARHNTIQHKVRGDISALPFMDNTFDLVTSNMVFEHLRDPGAQLREVFRILRPGGRLVFHTPNALGYTTLLARCTPEVIKKVLVKFLDNRNEDDVFPAFYRMNTEKKIGDVAKSAGFNLIDLRFILTTAQLYMVPPFVIFELILIRILMTTSGRAYRTNIIATLQKPSGERE